LQDIYGKTAGPRRPITPYQKKGPSRPSDTSKGGACGEKGRVMTRIVIVGLTPDSGIESQNSAVLGPGSGIVSQKWDVPYLPKWWSMRRRKRIFVFTQQAFYASQRSYIP